MSLKEYPIATKFKLIPRSVGSEKKVTRSRFAMDIRDRNSLIKQTLERRGGDWEFK